MTRTWHQCKQCGHQCPHDGDFCRCPWCLWTHDLDVSGPRIDPAQDGDGISHHTLLTEFECKMATIAGLLRVISGKAGITYLGEKMGVVGWSRQPVLAVSYNDPTIGPVSYQVWGTTGWDELQKVIPPLQALGGIHYGEDLAA